ncbi:3-amino-5-hydroxybenzoic acid synthase family [Candidatus Termititenax persephonae]|uniref:3-amino-5-hydroxybenzoic acid synthase family n=1 Tax=Candidatus Termititenax persephonae TaxID=2218525 RepID=A0A388TEQ4_9BACT|nr:3-amino-5-hydroxybenzoic acid synthase family [Candidatus Termititenax persephonae]
MLEYENLARLNAPFLAQYQDKFAEIAQKGWYILGNEVSLFEREFADYCGARYCVGVANGLDALTLSLRACAFPPQSEILVPANTYIATILAVLQAGHIPVLVEPDIRTYNLDDKLVEAKITAKTKAIMPVHLYGRLCAMPEILSLAQKYQLKIIEDAAQAHGAALNGRRAGAWGDLTAFSFYPTKNLGALGDGGAVTTDNAEYAERLKALRNYGSSQKYYNAMLGVNSRLDEVQAGFLRIKLKSLDKINAHKNKLAAIYQAELPGQFIKPWVAPEYYHVYHIYNIRHPERDRLKKYLAQQGIKTEIHYPVAPNKQQALRGILAQLATPLAEEIHRTTLTLPLSYAHTETDILHVCKILKKF